MKLFEHRYLRNVSSLNYRVEDCNGCKRCIEVCPQEVFSWDGKKAGLRDKDLCMECGACALNCETGAITVHAGVGCAEALINSMLTGGEPTCGCSDDSSSLGSCC
jgi:NAD-dependent dihydropyrimidine dehydrogenase PreA subunit